MRLLVDSLACLFWAGYVVFAFGGNVMKLPVLALAFVVLLLVVAAVGAGVWVWLEMKGEQQGPVEGHVTMTKLIVVVTLVLAVLVGLWLPAHADGQPVSPVAPVGTPEDIAIVAPEPATSRIGLAVVCVERGE